MKKNAMTLRTLPLTLALMAAFNGPASAQSLSQLFEAAKAHDATYKSARSQFDASLAGIRVTIAPDE